MEAIDFQHLRRVERQKARQLKAKSKQEGAVNEKEASFQTAQHDAIEYDYYYPPWDTKVVATSTSTTPLHPSRHVLTTNPPSLYYIPQFVTSDYSQALMAWLQALPAAQDHPNKNNNHNVLYSVVLFWCLSSSFSTHRRLDSADAKFLLMKFTLEDGVWHWHWHWH